MSFFKPFTQMRGYLLFWMCFTSLIGVFGLAYFKQVDIQILLPSILTIYAVHSGARQISAQYQARMADDVDTKSVLDSHNDK